MDEEGPAEGGDAVTAGRGNETFRLRSYQAEMVEASMNANIIVAMDTGSGKTHIALQRTAAALETCNPSQFVWFLAPTVALCEQQHKVFQTHLPGFESLVLTGNDNVDHWSNQSTWDAVLNNVRIVLTTHKVLLDALTHAFVKMSSLALLIFDEAHHCVGNHPANEIMKRFYTPVAQLPETARSLPRILGLSASPVMKASATEVALRKIEQNMHSTAMTPKLHRSELVQYVHRPELIPIAYPISVATRGPSSLVSLENALRNYDFQKDPYVVDLYDRQSQGYDCSRAFLKLAETQSTYCFDQLKGFVSKANAMMTELGPSPTDWYIRQCIWKYKGLSQGADQVSFNLGDNEKLHLANIFQGMDIGQVLVPRPMCLNRLSAKVETLIEVLAAEAGANFRALVFVEQRVWVAALAEIIALHPRTNGLFSIGTFVGSSNSSKRKGKVGDLAEPRNQQETLPDFRTGQVNLILATNVLEEGIDISSCHLVICFERPKNLKSFIQRRGRARMQKSKYVVLLPENTESPGSWEIMEEQMKKAYMDDLRKIQEAEEKEHEDDGKVLHYRVESTGALMTSDDALSHLHHFCSLLGSGIYVDMRPQFTFGEEDGGFITAEVQLPVAVDPAFRIAKSAGAWRTERMAKNDAAFQAYKALHLGGLLNDNLLPHRQVEDEQAKEFQMPDHMASLVEVTPTFDPWIAFARSQPEQQTYSRTLLTVSTSGQNSICLVLLTPRALPQLPPTLLHWNKSKEYSITSLELPDIVVSDKDLALLQRITHDILFSVFSGRMQKERSDFLWLLAPYTSTKSVWEFSELQQWHHLTHGKRPAHERLQEEQGAVVDWGLITIQGDFRQYIVKDVRYDADQSATLLEVTRLPKRRDFLHKVFENNQESERYTTTQWVDASKCAVESLPAVYCILALFIPSIVHRFEVFMLADTLRISILRPISIELSRLELLVRAITSSAASTEDNYQRLEFLGDCILKFIASLHLMAAHLQWPESYLTGKKGKLVSNGSLARATLTAGLDKYIVTKAFTGAKWAPRYVNNVLNTATNVKDKPIMRSSKLLADVIESLIGTSYVLGGFDKAFICMKTLLPLEEWTPVSEANTILLENASVDFEPTNTETMERLIGYDFERKTLLIEALTHASYNGPHADVRSYERLEFLGDAVLDYIISKRLFHHTPELSHQKMHGIRTSMANAAFLAFRMFETTIEEEHTNKTTFEREVTHRALWQFLRHNTNNYSLISSREIALKQHNETKTSISEALQQDMRFPWHLFALNDAPKFLSDIVESVIGAIYIDSRGSINACEVFVRRLGILDCLERILRDGVDCLHPKERLGILAVERKVQYVKLDAAEGSKMYRCRVKVGDQDIGDPTEGLKKLNAETIAAWKAVGILEKGDLRKDEEVMTDVDASTSDEWHDAEEGGDFLATAW